MNKEELKNYYWNIFDKIDIEPYIRQYQAEQEYKNIFRVVNFDSEADSLKVSELGAIPKQPTNLING